MTAFRWFLVLFGFSIVLAQAPGMRPSKQDPAVDDIYGRTRKQSDDMLKEDHVKNVADATELAKLSAELREELDKTDAHVLSIGLIKKTEEIEKLAHRIRGRIKR